jgi:hypothetical protein
MGDCHYTFSGHESFPCKTLWLKKGYDFIEKGGDFNASEAVVDLGVGKNMVSAIRFWIKSFGLNKDSQTHWIAEYILNSNKGKDPYMEDLGTLWLLHFLLVYTNEASLYKLFFIDFQKERRLFNKDQVTTFVKRKMRDTGKENSFNKNTVKKDVGVLLHNYCLPRNPQSNEDFSTLLMDLDLLRQTDKTDGKEDNEDKYYFNIEGKREVTPSIFLFAVLLIKEKNDNSIPYDVLHELGLIFCMTDLEIIDMLKLLSDRYSDTLSYSDVAGIRQLQFTQQMDAKQVLDNYYEKRI